MSRTRGAISGRSRSLGIRLLDAQRDALWRGQARGDLRHRARPADGLARERIRPGAIAMRAPQAVEVRAGPGLLERLHQRVVGYADHGASVDLEGEALAAGHGVASIPGHDHAAEGIRALELVRGHLAPVRGLPVMLGAG